jgi:hypothetical protein
MPAITIGRPSLLLRLTVLVSLLILAGDIESNPGPREGGRGGENLSQPRLNFSTTNSYENPRPNTRLNSVAMETERHFENDNSRGSQSDNVLQNILDQLSRLNDKFDGVELKLDREISALREENTNLTRRVIELEIQQDNLEAQSRRNNLIFRGIAEGERETWDQTEEKVRAFMVDKLCLSQDEAGSVDIERAHRLPGKGKDRLVITKFLSYKGREKVLRTARDKLRDNPDFRVREDYTKRVRDIRSRLFPFMKDARAKNNNAGMSYDKLRIGRQDYEMDDIVEVRRLPHWTPVREGTGATRGQENRQVLAGSGDARNQEDTSNDR